MEMARCMMHSRGVPYTYWGEAVNTTVYILNRSPCKALQEITPEEAWSKIKPEVSAFRIFGSAAYTLVPDRKRSKLDSKSSRYFFVGYSDHSKAYRLIDTSTNKIIISRDVDVKETESFFGCNQQIDQQHGSDQQGVVTEIGSLSLPDDESGHSHTPPQTPVQSMLSPTESFPSPGNQLALVSPPEVPLASESSVQRRPKWYYSTIQDLTRDDLSPLLDGRSRRPGKRIDYSEQAQFALASDLLHIREPQKYSDARGIPEWETAMQIEYDALIKNDTWKLVPLPPGKHPIGCKWVYKIKCKADGTLDKYKARLVAKGFSQQEGIDYEETFAPTAKMVTFRLLLAFAAQFGWKIYQMDVKSAFLNGDLEEEVYMTQPEGFQACGREHLVCRLIKSLYGLKQAPRAWYIKIDTHLRDSGFKRSHSDPNLYVKSTNDDIVILIVYVDDLAITGSGDAAIHKVKSDLCTAFDMTDLGLLHYCLGVEFWQQDHLIFISQVKYATNLLQKFKMYDCNSSSTPMEVGLKLSAHDDSPPVDETLYRQLVGSLIYLTTTQPDLCFAVSYLSRFLSKPKLIHWGAAKRVLRYVKGTLDFGILYQRVADFTLIGYTDSDWGGSVDTRRSTTGYIFSLGSGVISWQSKLQPTVAISSTEAEYKAAVSAGCEAVWLRQILVDFQFSQVTATPLSLFCDNQGVLKMVKNPIYHARTKHIEIHHHYIRQLVDSGEISLHFCPSQEQSADVMTKPLGAFLFVKFQDKLGPKFGYYGSFLPTQERSPQRHQQSNSSVPEHNYSSQKTINEGAVEKGPRSIVTDVSLRIGSIDCRNSSLHDSTSCDFTKETLAVNGAKIDEISPQKKKPVNGIRLRFKLGPDTISCPKNSAIYTGLGLQNSSSTSLEGSPDKGQMTSSEVESFLDSSPLSIIRIMTSYQVPGGSLLSPLQNILKEGQGKRNLSSKDIKRRTGKVQATEDHSANSTAFEYGNDIQAPMPKKDMTTGIFESKKEPLSQLSGDRIKKVRKDAGTKCKVSKASDVMDSKSSSKFSNKELYKGESDMGVACNLETNIRRGRSLVSKEPIILANGKDIGACLYKDENFEAEAARHPDRSSKTEKGPMPGCVNEIHKNQEEEHTKEPIKKNGHKNVSDVRKINKSFKEVNTIGLSEAIAYQEKNMLNDKCNGVPKAKVLGQVATHKKALVNTEHVKDTANEKTHDINMLKKAMKEESKQVKYDFKESVNERPWGIKGQKGPAKTNSKDLCANHKKYKNELADIKKENSMAPCNESTKPAMHKRFDRELSRGIEREKKRHVADEHDSKKVVCASHIKAHISKEADTQSLPEQFTTKDPVAGSSLGFDDWVCCDACEKWRLCPIGLKLSPLPKKWLCHMMFWLPGMNRCDVPQEETTQAIYNLYTITQTQVHLETNQGNVQLPATVSTALPDPKPSDQIQPRSLQSSTKFGNIKKGLVQRSMPNVSGTVTFLNSFAEKDDHSPVKNKSDLYGGHMEQEDGNTGFSQYEDEEKSNGLIKQLNKIKEKGKLKQISGGQANDIKLGNVHTLNVKRKRDGKSKECTPLKKMKAKQESVHDAEGVDLQLISERTDYGFKILKYDKLTKEKKDKLTKDNGVEILNKESKFKDQQQATKKRKHKLWKEGKTTHQELLETNRMADSEAGEEERQPEPKRVKTSKTESSQPLVSKGIRGGKEQIVKSVSSNLEHILHEMEDHGMQQSDEHGSMQKASDHTEPLKKGSSCRPPFVSTTSSSSKYSCYTKSLGTVPNGQGSPVESSVSSSPLRNLKAVKLSLARFKNVGKDDFMDPCNMMTFSPRNGLIGDVRSDHSGLFRTKDLCIAPGTNEKYRIDMSTHNTCRDMNNSGGRDGQQLVSTKPKDESFDKHLTSNDSFRVQERGNEKAKCDMGVEILDYESTESKLYDDPFIRKSKAWEFSSKDRRMSSHYSPEQERALTYSLAERNVPVETDSIKAKTKISPHSANRSEGRGYDSRPDILCYKGNQLEGSLINASSGESSRGPRESGTCFKGTSWPQLKSPVWNGFVGRDIERVLASPKREIWSSTANAALQEGRDLKQKADGLKNNGGDELGFIGFYFRASLKFLQSASIFEPLNAGSARQGENKSMALFTYSARLSENCAKTYERNGKWAAATLAYQCTGVAHMHVIMANTASISKDRRELQSAALLIPNGESPRSSASDVDNLNCCALTIKDSYMNQEKGVTSLHASGNYLINTQNCQQYNRVLQFVDDTNAAFDAFAKANFAFAAINDSSYKEQEISAVKRAIDLNFHNVDGLLRLVLPVMESIDL
ncbi:hypothetical protein KI387_008352 [Taxus chinensis]|uniref:CW-type domain-containing protein n=1 Tax=Taxus chinensis TaxID=29808 RepID=A0AA38CVK4_TAXCH|nr:hypothetical protein KI387_008352 [Taxus chinensis]